MPQLWQTGSLTHCTRPGLNPRHPRDNTRSLTSCTIMGTPKLQIFNLLKITQFSKCSIIHVILFWPFVEWLDTNKVKVTHFSLWNWKKVSKISPCIKIPFISLFLNINSSLHECTDYNLYISYICNIDLYIHVFI